MWKGNYFLEIILFMIYINMSVPVHQYRWYSVNILVHFATNTVYNDHL